MYPANRKQQGLRRVAKSRRVLGVGRHITVLLGMLLLLASTTFPNPQKKRDLFLKAQPGSKEEAIVIANARRLFAWYSAFVLPNPRVIPLPTYLPDTQQNDLFTHRQAIGHADKLPPGEREEVIKFVNDRVKLIGEEDARVRVSPLERTMPQRPRMVFFTNPVAGNSIDLIGAVVQTEQAARVQDSVSSLVEYKLYNQNRASLSSVPAEMYYFIRDEYERLRTYLLGGEQKLNDVRFTIDDSDEEKKVLLMEARINKKFNEVRFSPLVVRAMFMQVIRDDGDVVVSTRSIYLSKGGDPRILENSFNFNADALNREGQPGRQLLRTLREIPDPFNKVIENFREAFSFALAHEMAHFYLGDGRKLEADEMLCDAAALELWKRANCKVANCKVKLGAFENILNQAIEEGRADLWNMENEGEKVDDLKKRYELLKQRINQ